MKRMRFSEAIDSAVAQAMSVDDRIIVFGEDVPMLRRTLLVRFGRHRVMGAPISESAFVGAAVAAAMAGLRPIVELYMVDFMSVAMDAVLNHAAKLKTFSGGDWTAPLVIRAPCGGGYGDGGQHGQSLWGWLAHIPGISVVVPSNPADAGRLMTAALNHDGPVVFLEHKLLSESWLDFLGAGGRTTVEYDVPEAGTEGPVPSSWTPTSLGRATICRSGTDITVVSLGVGVHRSLEVANRLEHDGISCEVMDLVSVAPLDHAAILKSAGATGRLLVVDEDYEAFGLSGELAAIMLEAGISVQYARVCTRDTIPYARSAENDVLPNVDRIYQSARALLRR